MRERRGGRDGWESRLRERGGGRVVLIGSGIRERRRGRSGWMGELGEEEKRGQGWMNGVVGCYEKMG